MCSKRIGGGVKFIDNMRVSPAGARLSCTPGNCAQPPSCSGRMPELDYLQYKSGKTSPTLPPRWPNAIPELIVVMLH